MNISEASLGRPARTCPFGPSAAPRVAESQRKGVSANVNWALYIVPHIAEDRAVSIAKLAYLKAQGRGFAPGHELEDWLAAENEVDQRLAGEGRVF
jgi:Protein of unknown function (DUF2934)